MSPVSPVVEHSAFIESFEVQVPPVSRHVLSKNYDTFARISGPRLNIKTVLSTYGDFHVKDKTAVRTSYL